jgi:hypothetical protein
MSRILTYRELRILEAEIDWIAYESKVLNPDIESDNQTLIQLDDRLQEIIVTLERSRRLARMKELGLQLILGHG